jgi:hypothetical protein
MFHASAFKIEIVQQFRGVVLVALIDALGVKGLGFA